MKKIILGLVIALATPVAAYAADAAHKCCCCCDKEGGDHADHKDMRH